MIPIQALLSRIRWDKEFGKGRFEIGYYDRLERRIKRVPFNVLQFDNADHYAFQLTDEGDAHMIPFHRAREVYRDGVLIWRRDG